MSFESILSHGVFGLSEALKILYAHLIAYLLAILCFTALDFWNVLPLSVVVVDCIISNIIIGCVRISKRIVIENLPEAHRMRHSFLALTCKQQM